MGYMKKNINVQPVYLLMLLLEKPNEAVQFVIYAKDVVDTFQLILIG